MKIYKEKNAQTVFLSGTDEMRPISISLYEKLTTLHFEQVTPHIFQN